MQRHDLPSTRLQLGGSFGAVANTTIDLLAADQHEKSGGFELALAELVACLIRLTPDEVTGGPR